MNKNVKIAKELLKMAKVILSSENEEIVEQWVKAFASKYLEGTVGHPTVVGTWLWITLTKNGGYCHWGSSTHGIPSWRYDTKFPKFDMPLQKYRKELAKAFKSLSNDVVSFFSRTREYSEIEKDVKKACDWLDSLADAALNAKVDFKVGDITGMKCVNDEYERHEKAGDLDDWLSQYHWNEFLPPGNDSKYGRIWVDWEKRVYRDRCTISEFYGGATVD